MVPKFLGHAVQMKETEERHRNTYGTCHCDRNNQFRLSIHNDSNRSFERCGVAWLDFELEVKNCRVRSTVTGASKHFIRR